MRTPQEYADEAFDRWMGVIADNMFDYVAGSGADTPAKLEEAVFEATARARRGLVDAHRCRDAVLSLMG